ncbi:MAG: alanine--tRNA ligase [Myxococcota bacterium]
MESNDIRSRFLQFFSTNGHTAVDSGSLVPSNDPTLFFTNAGMVPFKDVFTGREKRSYTRASSSQKCLRVSGKHNDLENVGRTPRHHTFFEMLGNFSFGDYFKEEAIRLAWTFLTEELKIPAEKLWVTVFESDDEAEELWKRIGVEPDRIQRLGAKDNFWSMGDTGPCGPCSEIFYDHGPDYGPGGGPETESDRYIEIWNLVFMQFNRDADGTMEPLPRPSIDTGMGLERVAAVMQGVYSNYDTDAFQALMNRAAALAKVTIGDDEECDVALRVIADHARATGFLIADGVMPSNEERGYVLRRIMRRAIRYGVKIGLKDTFLVHVVDTLIDHMGDNYSELRQRADFIREVVKGEEERFSETLDKGLALLDQAVQALDGGTEISGQVAFKLHDTYGFPLDLTQLIADERGLTVNVEDYTACMEAQRAAGRAAWKGSGQDAVSDVFHSLVSQGIHTDFTGYSNDKGTSTIVAIVLDGQSVDVIEDGQSGILITEATPFYGEAGGQTGDTGTITGTSATAQVTDTQKPVDGLTAHFVSVAGGSIKHGEVVQLEVDADRRDQIRLNHTATHLLHAALQGVLGEHVLQKGSMVAADRLRFDFSHHKAVTQEELSSIESQVYAQVLANAAVTTEECSMDEAKAQGAMALFGEKYGDDVRVVSIPGYSTELCGGTHARRTGDIGVFKILSESSVAAGVRRIEAETGLGAMDTIRQRESVLSSAAYALRTSPEQLTDAIQRINDDRKRLAAEIEDMRRQMARDQSGDLISQAREIDGFLVLSAEISADAKTLREEADRLRDSMGTGVVVLGSREENSVKLVVAVSKDIAGKKVHAGNLIRTVAGMVGGGGGGRPDMAQAGGKDPSALPAALEAVYDLVGA